MLLEKGAPGTLGVSCHRTPTHGGPHGSTPPHRPGSPTPPTTPPGPPGHGSIVPPGAPRGHRAMAARPVLLPLAGGRRRQVVAAAAGVAGAADGLGRRADAAGPLRGRPRRAAVAVPQV